MSYQSKAKPKEKNIKYASFLNYCRQGNSIEVENLLKNGEIKLNHNYVTGKYNRKEDPLCCAVESDNIDTVNILLRYGAKVNTTPKDVRLATSYEKMFMDFMMPLHVACQKGNYEIVEMLIKCGAHVDRDDHFGLTPLYYAVENKHIRIVKLLLQKLKTLNISKNVRWYRHTVPKHVIYDEAALDIIKLLLDHKAIQIESLFSDAVVLGIPHLLQFLIDEGADVNFPITNSEDEYYEGHSPLCSANSFMSTDRREVMKILLKSGADPNLIDKKGNLPFANAEYVSLMKILLRFGADINGQDAKGNTALHYCRGQKSMIFLISRGINTNIKNNENQTAGQIFEEIGWILKERLDECYAAIMKEICRMKKTILNNYGLSLHDILLIHRHDLSRYVNNNNLRRIFRDLNFFIKFPVFGEILRRKFVLAKRRHILMILASRRLENLTGVRMPEVHSMIFKYFSDNEIKYKFVVNT